MRIEGVDVGGMKFSEAETLVRARIAETLPPLVVHAPCGDVVVRSPALSFTDNVPSLVRTAKRGENLRADVRRNWADMEAELLAVCEQNFRAPRDAELSFSPAGFVYLEGEKGVSCDYARLLADAARALETGEEVFLSCRETSPAVTEKQLRARTRRLSRFSTAFDGGNVSRAHNVRLAAARVGGTVVEPGEEFSFNARVGRRTRENGFVEATVIQQGEFVQGVGGGVCQTSTTLLGAAIRAGMKITASRPHSLAVSYVPPSQDAMVSDYSDLKFVNPYSVPVYILARTARSSVAFEFYGLPDGKRYAVESCVLERLPPPEEKVVKGEEEKIVQREREGIKSESWLLEYDERGNLLSRTLFRRDTYAPVQGVRESPIADPAEDGPSAEPPA